MPTIPSSLSAEIKLDNSRDTPIGEDHDIDIFSVIHEPLDSGDFDEQDANDEAICELVLTHKLTVKRSLTCLLFLLRHRLWAVKNTPPRVIDSWI